MKNPKVWYVTGASQGLGLELVKQLLQKGHRVAATSRNAQKLKDAVGIIDKERFLPLVVDLSNTDSIEESIEKTIAMFGQIDVVINNAGYGMVGTVEEITAIDIKKIFDVNVLVPLNVIRTVLPFFRSQHSGYIINIGSIAGFAGVPGWSVYSATKAALASFSEVLALDVKEFGIKVTVVEPAGFRTGFLTEGSLANIGTSIDGYAAVKSTRERYLAGNGKQPGDPEKAVQIIIELVDMEEPPLHLYLGQDAYNRASGKLAAMMDELELWKSTTLSADYK